MKSSSLSSFTIVQSADDTDLFLVPNSDISSCTELTPFGDVPNYACIDDDRNNPDEDTTYVYSTATITEYDLYGLPNTTLTTPVINYVQVYARAKSHLYQQHINGIYKILISPDSICTHVYKSDDIGLTTSYKTYSNVWTTDPSTGVAWTWATINAMACGIECSSPTTTGADFTLTLRPNAAGTNTNCDMSSCTINYECVNEAVANGTTDYIYNDNAAWDLDTYNVPNHTTQTGTISKVVLFYVARPARGFGATGTAKFKGAMRTGGTVYYGTTYTVSGSNPPWQTYSDTWTNNPNTGTTWTWNDIDNLEIGISIYGDGLSLSEAQCTQVYAVVYYNEDTNPEIRTTLEYVKVNYGSSSATCFLNLPKETSFDHGQNIKILNFWNGSREVYGISRSNKTLVLNGEEWDYGDGSACDRIICIRNMARSKQTVVISNLEFDLFNDTFRILEFGWKKISEKPEHYEWILYLEYAS